MSIFKNVINFLFFVACSTLVASADVIKVPGITEPLRDADISAPVAGKIDVIHYREGQFVEEGTVVIQLEDELERLKVDRQNVIFKDKSDLETAIAEMETAKMDLESTQELFDKTKIVSRDELNDKILRFKQAKANKDKSNNGELREEIELKIAKFELEQRAIKADFSGEVAEVYLEEGEDCRANDPVFRLVDSSKCHFTCNMENSLAANLDKNQEVDLEITVGLETIKKKGEIEFIAPTIDAASGLRKVKILVDNPDFKITPGSTGTLNINVENAK